MRELKLITRVPVSSFVDERGTLGVCELENVIPFAVKRIYFISDVPNAESRGSHAHKELEQVFISLKGSFELKVTDGVTSDHQVVTNPGDAFHVPKGLWRDLSNFSPDAVCLVLASTTFDASDYIHSFPEYLEWRKS